MLFGYNIFLFFEFATLNISLIFKKILCLFSGFESFKELVQWNGHVSQWIMPLIMHNCLLLLHNFTRKFYFFFTLTIMPLWKMFFCCCCFWLLCANKRIPPSPCLTLSHRCNSPKPSHLARLFACSPRWGPPLSNGPISFAMCTHSCFLVLEENEVKEWIC